MAFKKEEFRAMIEREGLADFIFAKSWKDIEGTQVGLFEMINGRVGCVFQIYPTVYIGPKTEKKLSSFYNGIDLPDKSSLQFFSFASRKIENFVETYNALHSNPANVEFKETLNELRDNKIAWFNKYRNESIFSQGNDLRLRNFVNLVVITIPKEKGRGIDFSESELVSNFTKVEQMLNEFAPRKFTRQQWVSLMREILNPDSEVEYIPDDEYTELNFQIVDNNSVLILEEESMGIGNSLTKEQYQELLKKESNAEHDLQKKEAKGLFASLFGKKEKEKEEDKQEAYANWHAKVFTTKMFPKTISIGEVSSKFYDFIGEKMTPTVPCPFFLSLTVYYENREKIKSEVGEKVKWNLWQTKSLGDSARFFPEILARAQEAEQINVMLHEGESPLYASWSVTIMDAGVANVRKYGESLKKEFMRSNWVIQEEELIPHWIFLYSLPLNFEPYVLKDLAKRMNTLFTSNIAAITPILTGDRGSGAPVLTYIDRGGQVAGVNIFDSPTNYNFVVIGASGSGKSYLMADFFTNYLMIGSKIRVIDVGRSYKHLCDAIGGQNIEFTPENKVCLNFFTNVQIDEDTGLIHQDEMQTIVPLVGLMAMQSVDNDSSEDIKVPVLKGYISKAVSRAFKNSQRNAGMQDVLEALEQMALEIKQETSEKEQLLYDLINSLYSFGHPEGEFYEYFNGENNLKFRSDFVVIELEEIDSKKLLKSVVLAAISHSINSEFFLGERTQTKILIIDEAWSILENPIVAKFLETMARRIRKYNGASGIITQGFGDFDKSDQTRAIFQNSAWKMFLKQDKESITAAKSSGTLTIDETLIFLMETIKSNPPYYSEILMKNSAEQFFIGRLMTDPVAHWIYTGHPDDNAKIKQVEEELGVSTLNARLIIGYATQEKKTYEEVYIERMNAGKIV